MKWFKHFTDSLDDPFIVSLMDRFKATGYVAFFGLIEIICKENGHEVTGKLSIEPSYLRRKLRTSEAKLQQVYEFCQTSGKLTCDFSKEVWCFEFPKIAKIKDNHTSNLQAADKKLALEVEVEVDKEKDIKAVSIKPEKEKPIKHKYGEYKNVLLTDDEKEKLIKVYGRNEALKQVEALSEYIGSTGKVYKSHFITIKAWFKKEGTKAKRICEPNSPMPVNTPDKADWTHPDLKTIHQEVNGKRTGKRAKECENCGIRFEH